MAASSNAAGVAAGYSKLIEGLCDLGEGRISAMDAAGVDVQVLSLTFPGVEQLKPPPVRSLRQPQPPWTMALLFSPTSVRGSKLYNPINSSRL